MQSIQIGTIGNLIDGTIVAGEGADEVAVLNPATEEVLGSFADSTSHDVDRAVSSARRAFPGWAALSPGARADVIRQLANLVEAHLDELATLEVLDAGKPWSASRNGELPGILESLRHFGAISRVGLAQAAGEYVPGNTSYLRREPRGVVAAVTPWNFPLWQAIWKIAPALACGNTVVLKPSEKDPSAVLLIARWLTEAGLPDGVLNVVNGDKVAVDRLLEHPEVRAVSFVGSTPIARYIYETGTRNGKRVQALGGAKNHMVVLADADLDVAADAVPAERRKAERGGAACTR